MKIIYICHFLCGVIHIVSLWNESGLILSSSGNLLNDLLYIVSLNLRVESRGLLFNG
jgi:hypothetical protein